MGDVERIRSRAVTNAGATCAPGWLGWSIPLEGLCSLRERFKAIAGTLPGSAFLAIDPLVGGWNVSPPDGRLSRGDNRTGCS